jgi:precorrin-6B methylase 2
MTKTSQKEIFSFGCLKPFFIEAKFLMDNHDDNLYSFLDLIDRVPGWQTDMQIAILSCFSARQGENKTFCEIGTWRGRSFITFLLANASLIGFSVDTFKGSLEHSEQEKNSDCIRCSLNANLNAFGLTSRVRIAQGLSTEIAKKMDVKFDFIFIDGDHSYQGVKDDIESWYPHLKSDGFMLGHDYPASNPDFQELKKAVDEQVRFDDRFTDFGCARGIWGAVKK